jgi:hypothetical protein
MVPAADAGAYMGKNDWNSLGGQVKRQRSHASSEVVPAYAALLLCGLRPV